MTDPVNDTPKPAEDKVVPWPHIPYRVTPEVVIRSLLSQIDRVEDVVVVFRLRGKPGLLMNYNTDIQAMDLLVAASTTRALAEQKIGLTCPYQLPLSDTQLPPEGT